MAGCKMSVPTPSNTLPNVHYGGRPAADQWQENPLARRMLAVGVLYVIMGVGLAGIMVGFALLRGPLLEEDTWVLVALAATTGGPPLVLGAYAIQRSFITPKAVGSSPSSIFFQFRGKTWSVPYGELTCVGTRPRWARGPTLVLGLRSGQEIKVRGVPPIMLEGVVSQVERRAPQVAAQEPWAVAVLPGGRAVPDARLMPGIGSPFTALLSPQRDVWVTPTDVMMGRTQASRAAVMAMLPLLLLMLLILSLTIMVRFVDDGVTLLVVFGAFSLAALVLPLRDRLRFRPGRFSVSEIRFAPRDKPFERLIEVGQRAVKSAGLAPSTPRRGGLLGGKRAQWKLSAGMTLLATESTLTNTSMLRLTTLGPHNAEVHRLLKGFVLAELGAGPPGVPAATAETSAGLPTAGADSAAAPAEGAAAWNEAVLPDGGRVPDAPFAMVPDASGSAEAAWRSRSQKTDRRLIVGLVPVLGAVMMLPIMFVAWEFGLPFGTSLTASAVASAVLVGAIMVYSLPQIRGQAGMALLFVPPAFSTHAAVGPVVDRALARLGVRVKKKGAGTLGYLWALEGGLKVRFQEEAQMIQPRLLVSGRGPQALDPFVRLKGLLLDELGLVSGGLPTANLPVPAVAPGVGPRVSAPPTPVARVAAPPPGAPAPLGRAAPPAPAGPVETGQAAPPGFQPLGLPRGAPPPPLPNPPAWANAAHPAWPGQAPDGTLPESGVEALPPGWWASRPLQVRGSTTERRATLFATALMMGIATVVVAGSLVRSSGSRSPAALLLSVVMLAGIVVVAVVLTWWTRRRERKKSYERDIHSYMRVDTGPVSLVQVAGTVGAAAVGVLPSLWPLAPPPGAVAHWRENTGVLSLTLWTPRGHMPYLELKGSGSDWPAVRVKGAVYYALYGAPARPAATPPPAPPA